MNGMSACDRCGEIGADLFTECRECGQVDLCPSCVAWHRVEMAEDARWDTYLGEAEERSSQGDTDRPTDLQVGEEVDVRLLGQRFRGKVKRLGNLSGPLVVVVDDTGR